MTSELNIEKIKECVTDYCRENGIDMERLRSQRQIVLNGEFCFLQDNGVLPDGLRNDSDTVPYVTLIVKKDYAIEETEHTARFLRN